MPYRFGQYAPSFPVPSPLTLRDGSVAVCLGGDGGYECVLDATRSVWTFGDAYWAPAGTTQRHGSVVVGNVVAIGTCAGGAWSAKLYCGGSAGKPLAFFADGDPTTRFAALKPFLWGSKLYILLVRAANGPGHYTPLGSAVARVNNPLADPTAWQYDILSLWPGRPTFGCEAIVLPPDLLLMGSDGGGGNWPVKLPLAALAVCPDGGDLGGALEYWNGSGWKPGVTGVGAVDCGVRTTSGLSLRFDGGLKSWLGVWCDTTVHGGFPPYASLAMGGSPMGPWSEAARLYFPEMAPGDPLFNPDNTCYGIHELTDFESEPNRGALRLAYSVGSRAALLGSDFTRQLSDLSCYRVAVASFADPFG